MATKVLHTSAARRKRGYDGATVATYHIGAYLQHRFYRRPLWQTMTTVSQDDIALACRVSTRTVRTALRWWTAQGAITRRLHQPVVTGGRRPDLLFVHRQRLRRLLHLIRAVWLRSTSASDYSSVGDKINRLRTDVRRLVTDVTETLTKGLTTMQGKLFQRTPRARARKPIDPDSPNGRLQTWRRLYARHYGRPCVIASIPQTLGAIARLREALPTALHWSAACEAYLRQADRNVVDAGHPLHWLARRLPALMSAVTAELVRQEAIARDHANLCDTYIRDIERLGGTVDPAIRRDAGALAGLYRATEQARTSTGPSEREIAALAAREANRAALRAQWNAIRGTR